MVENIRTKLEKIRLLAMDVDGVLTDGTIVVNADGSESKSFSALDGHGLKLWKRVGLEVAWISGRTSEPTRRRAKQLEVVHVFEECHDKLPVIAKLIADLGLNAENVAYIGDDLPDLPVIRYVGFGAAVANAVAEVKHYADYLTKCSGGKGAVREVVEHILRNTGRWETLMNRYLP